MSTVATDHVRNVVLLSHGGAGKTVLAEAMLYAAGVTTRMGTITDGNTASDFEDEETKRQSSVQTSIIPVPWKDHKINLIDTPGYADFRGEALSGARVADAAVILVDAVSGVEVGTRQMWKLAADRGLPRFIFISKLDRENADFDRTLSAIEESFGRECVPVQIPVGSEASFSGLVNLLDSASDAPSEVEGEAEAAKERLIEAIAEADDDLATKYLEGEELTTEEITSGLKQGVADGVIVPVLTGVSTSPVGATELMDAIVDLMPSPADVEAASGTRPDSDEEVVLGTDGPLAALVFKTAADPFVGKLSYFRVYSGNFKGDSQLWNSDKGEAERVAQVFEVTGKSQEPVQQLAFGDIGAVAKLNSTLTGDTLCERENQVVVTGIEFPEPVYYMAASPKSKADLDKMTSAVARISEEDPSLVVTREPDTHELLLGGLGDMHVEVAIEKMARKFAAEIVLSTPKVAYKESITGSSRVEYRHKKQSGGHGQFAHVWLTIEPLPRGSGFEFAQSVVGGSVPREYIPSVEKGCRRAIDDGVVGGYPVVDIKATLVDGGFHPVDSSGVSFEIAGANAFSKGVEAATPVLLEPVMSATITVPESFAGDVMGDLNSKRARILGMNPIGEGMTEVGVEVPQGEMLRYATELRSQTQGQGFFTIAFDHYEEVPSHLTQRIVEDSKETAEATA